MRRFIILGAIALLAVFTATAVGNPEPQDQDEERSFIVGFHDLPNERAQYHSERVTFYDEDLRYFVVEPENDQRFENQAKNDDRVRYVQENHNDIERFYEPNDEHYPQQYGPQITDTHWAWAKTLGSTAVTIGFLDGGITVDHEDIDATRVTGWNYYADNDDISEGGNCDYHGSHVVGIAAALTDNEAGIAGKSQSSIIMQKMWGEGLLECSAASVSDFAQALKDLADQGAHISSNSWGGTNDQAIHDAIRYASDKGVIHVAAAGNHGPCDDCVAFPWRDAGDHVIIASASDEEDTFASFSSQGPEVSVIAPGDDVLSVDGSDPSGYTKMSGTSMSAPHVSGAIALYIDAHGHPGDHATMEQLVRDSADDLWLPEDQQGDGRLNVAKLVHGEAIGPTAAFNASCEGRTCTFNASSSFDSHDEIIEHEWSLSEDLIKHGETVEHTFDEDNTHRVELTVVNSTRSTDNTDGYVTATVPDADTGQTRLFHDGFEDQTLWSWSMGGHNNLWRIANDCVEPWNGAWMLAFSIEEQCDFDDGHVQGYVTTPRIDASGLHNVTLSFAHFFEVEEADGAWDVMRVKASDNGRDFDTIAQWDARNHTNEDWEEVTLDVSSYASENLTVRFFFDSFDRLANDYLGWDIDDVEIQGTDPSGSMHVASIDSRNQGPHAWIEVTIHEHEGEPLPDVDATFEICPEDEPCQTVTEKTGEEGVADHRWKHLSGNLTTVCVLELEHPNAWWFQAMDSASEGSCETLIA